MADKAAIISYTWLTKAAFISLTWMTKQNSSATHG
jgi:hypothetical protein